MESYTPEEEKQKQFEEHKAKARKVKHKFKVGEVVKLVHFNEEFVIYRAFTQYNDVQDSYHAVYDLVRIRENKDFEFQSAIPEELLKS